MNAGGQNLDTRLLRYRGGGGEESPVALAEELMLAGRPNDAVDVLAIALKARPDDHAAMLMDGRARFASGDLLGAQAALLKLARETPKDKEPFRWLGEVLLKRGDPARAAKVLERAFAIDRNDAAVNRLLERAQRLSKVADGAEAPPSVPPPPPQKARMVPEERTAVRPDLTNQLRQMAHSDDVHDRPTAQANAYGGAGIAPPTGLAQPLSFDEAAGGRAEAPNQDFDDEPTNILSGELSPLTAISAPAHEDIAPPKRSQRPPGARRASTLGYGMAPDLARTNPVGRPLPDIEPPTRAAGRALPDIDPPTAPAARGLPPKSSFEVADDIKTAVGKKNVGVPTSPGAAAAPMPPPPKRQLGKAASDPFSASEDEIEGALDLLGDPVPPPSRGRPAPPFQPLDDPFAVAAARTSGVPPLPSTAAAPPQRRAPEPQSPPFAPAAPEPQRRSPPPDEEDFDEPMFGMEPSTGARSLAPNALGTAGVENVDKILSMLREQGLFEPPNSTADGWAKRGEVKKAQGISGTRIGFWMGAVWLLAIGMVVGGYYGWQEWVRRRHVESAALVVQATGEAYRGSHADLVDAERHLTDARALDAHDASGPTLLLFVHAQAALEDGAFDPVHIRPAIQRAEGLEVEGDEAASVEAYLDVARAVLQIAEGSHATARDYVAQALAARPTDPAILYLVGRLEQRLGGEEALTHLTAATEGNDEILAPRIALAEALYDEGRAEEALELINGILAHHDDHLRAQMWKAFMTADTEDPQALLASIRARRESLHPSFFAPTDNLLFHLTSARLLRRTDDEEAAAAAVDEALSAGATEPRLLALVAVEGKRAGRLRRAEQAARTAVNNAPYNADFRKLLAEIQLARQAGREALETLADLPNEDPAVVEMRAQAALLLGNPEALTEAAVGLESYIEGTEEPSTSVRALRIRLRVALGEAEAMLPDARALVAEAPGDPFAALALGETALRLFDSETAVETLDQVVAVSPDNGEAHYLLGRARRMAGDDVGAEQSLRRAVTLIPEHTDAKIALAGLLLDRGEYAGADEVYRELSNSVAGGRAIAMSGRLGRVEALIGLGNLGDAQVQYDGVSEEGRDTPTGREVGARLALAKGQAGEALTLLRPIASAEEARAPVLALYGDALLEARQTEPAAEAYARAVAQDAGLPEALLGQAELAVRAEQEDEAMEALGRLQQTLERRIRPPALRARFQTLLGRAHLLGDRTEEATTALRAAIELEPNRAEAHFFLGEALSESDSPDARASYERYLELEPEGRYASRARRASR